VAGGVGAVFENVDTEVIYGAGNIFDARWVTLTFLSATAIICLPRQFQVTVVENVDERHLATASWLFPLYLFGMCLFVMPIAIAGLKFLPAGANPDLYVLTLPLSLGREDLALFAFLGGFSSATSMVIVAAIAVSTMVSNHIVVPISLYLLHGRREVSGDVRKILLRSRRVSIAAVVGLGFLYFQASGGSDALAAIGLIAFVGVAQFLPSLLGGIFWRGATRNGALSGLLVGFVLWAYTLFLPSFGGSAILGADVLANGLFGIAALRPQALFGLAGLDPLVHAVIWSLGANTLAFMIVSSLSEASPLDRLQGALFVDVFSNRPDESTRFEPGQANAEDLFVLAQRILGTEPARQLFDSMAQEQGSAGVLPWPTDAMIVQLERVLAGNVGAASAHAMVSRVAGRGSISMIELIDIADETRRLMETSRELSNKSAELTMMTNELRMANQRLRQLDLQKDEFLSQVSHELRTPMTAIRSFSEILLSPETVTDEERNRFITIINEESQRLTRLLNEILDMSRLEAGILDMPLCPVEAGAVIDTAIDTLDGLIRKKQVRIERQLNADPVWVQANEDRLHQILINLISNSIKYNISEDPVILVRSKSKRDVLYIDISDNGGGVKREEAATIFDKFSRGHRSNIDHGAGLGLSISRAIVRSMGGNLTLEFADDETSFFRLRLPRGLAPEGKGV
jgi:signal transduction histidine kinase